MQKKGHEKTSHKHAGTAVQKTSPNASSPQRSNQSRQKNAMLCIKFHAFHATRHASERQGGVSVRAKRSTKQNLKKTAQRQTRSIKDKAQPENKSGSNQQ